MSLAVALVATLALVLALTALNAETTAALMAGDWRRARTIAAAALALMGAGMAAIVSYLILNPVLPAL